MAQRLDAVTPPHVADAVATPHAAGKLTLGNEQRAEVAVEQGARVVSIVDRQIRSQSTGRMWTGQERTTKMERTPPSPSIVVPAHNSESTSCDCRERPISHRRRFVAERTPATRSTVERRSRGSRAKGSSYGATGLAPDVKRRARSRGPRLA